MRMAMWRVGAVHLILNNLFLGLYDGCILREPKRLRPLCMGILSTKGNGAIFSDGCCLFGHRCSAGKVPVNA